MAYYASFFVMEFGKLLFNEEITASCKANVPKTFPDSVLRDWCSYN